MPFHDGALTQAVADLWLQGLTGGEIAKKLSHDLRRRISREAVMGRLFRLRAKHPAAVAERPVRPQRNMSKRVRKASARMVAIEKVRHAVPVVLTSPQPALPLVELGLPSGIRLSWHSIRGCAYIANDNPRAPAWCNARIVPGSSWCAYHHQRLSVVPRR